MQKADKNKIPHNLKVIALNNPKEEVLLPTGAKLYYKPGLGFWVSGYTLDDAKPYLEDNSAK